MAVASAASGTQLAVISTEHTLTTQTVANVYVLVVDLNNMVAGDELTLRLKTKVLTGSTSRLAYIAHFGPLAPEIDNVYSLPVPIDFEIVATLQQTAGTGRNFDWSLLTLQ